jgi:Na+-transporting NADH:ubiquinone oxidoreductase subunit NqrF
MLPNKTQQFGLPLGQHVKLHANIFNTSSQKYYELIRDYVPVVSIKQDEYISFLIKIIKDEFREEKTRGPMSKHLLNMERDDLIKISGPYGN